MSLRRTFGPLRIVARSFYRATSTEDLLARYVCDGDSDAFTVLVERFRGLVLRRCRSILNCDHLVQDAAQETFVELAQRAHQVFGPGALVRWLDTIARNKAVDIQRKERRR